MSDTYTDVVEERGEYRAKITIDTSPHEPKNEMGCPVLRIDSDGWRGSATVTDTGYGFGSTRANGINLMSADDALEYCIRQRGSAVDGVEMFSRWLRVWHGGSAVGYHLGYSREYGYCAYVTEAMVRNGWGNTTGPVPEPELSEWEAYCDGDVYWISVERRLLKRTEYVTFDDRHPVDADEAEVWFEEADSVVGGYYGEQYAREAALEALDDYAPKDETVGCSCGMADLGAEGHDHE